MKKMLMVFLCLTAALVAASCSVRTDDSYFKEVKDTGESLRVGDDLIVDGLYKGVTLDYKGSSYYKIGAYSVVNDGRRGEALINLTDGEENVTVYDYSYPSGFDMINVNSYLFVNEHQFRDVISFFNECDFSYTAVYTVPMQSSFVLSVGDNKLRWDEKAELVSMPDKLFLDAVNRSPDVCRLTDQIPSHGRTVEIRQTGSAPDFDRTVSFFRDGDDFYMRCIHDDMPRDGVLPNKDKCYEIVSPELREILKKRFDSVNVILRAKYGVNKNYY